MSKRSMKHQISIQAQGVTLNTVEKGSSRLQDYDDITDNA